MPSPYRYGGFSPRFPAMPRPRAPVQSPQRRGQVSFPTPQDVGAMQWEAAPPGGVDAEPTGLFGGNMNKFATLAGLAAYALSPNTAGGRMGSLAASYAMQQEQERRYDEAVRQQEEQQQRGEQERARQIGGLFESLAPRHGRLSLQEGPPEAPGYSGGVAPPVTTSLQGVEEPGSRPRITPSQTAQLFGLLGEKTGAAVLDQFRLAGQAPAEEELQAALTYQNLADPRFQALRAGRTLDASITKGQPTFSLTQPATPGAVEAQAITEQYGSPQARLDALRQQSRPFLTPAQQAEDALRREHGDRALLDRLHPPTMGGVEAGAIRDLNLPPTETLRAARGQAETPVALADQVNQIQQRIQSRRTELFGGVSATGMRIPGLNNVPLDDMIGLVNMAEQGNTLNERLSGERGTTASPLFGDLLPNRDMLRQINQGLRQRLQRDPTRDEVVREWAKILIGRRNRSTGAAPVAPEE
jgi:hypothetical protein